MEENFKNKLGLFTFIFIILFLAIGGYFFTNYLLNEKEDNKTNNNKEKQDYRIDQKKDYIYFTNSEVISEGAEIYYQDVVINLTTQETLNETLEKENQIYKNNIKYISDQNILSDEIINYNNDNLYALTFREYSTYEYEKFVSLVLTDYNYSCFDLITFNKTKSYIFNIETGKVLEEQEILKLYNTNIESIKEKIREYLLSKQEIIDEVELIKIEDTLNEFNNYSLYINEYGKLYISYLVKTSQVDYNEIMEVN